MAIVISVIESKTSRHAIEKHTDHLGNVYTLLWFYGSNEVPEDLLSTHASELATQLATSEVEEILND